MLVQAFLLDRLGAKRAEAVRLLTSFVDDPSPLVRRALSESLAHSAAAPRNIVVSLADDQSDVASAILEHSPVLRDSDLIDIAASRDGVAQAAIAARSNLSEPVAAALAEVAELEAALVLLENEDVKLPAFSLLRLIERFGEIGSLREAILKRGNLPSVVHVELVNATTNALSALVTGREWLKRERMVKIATETRDRAAVTISALRRSPSRDLVSYLRQKGQLTTALVLRTVLSGNIDLFRAMLAELADLDEARVDSMIRNPKGSGFAAAFRRTDLPQDLLSVFRCALRATSGIEDDNESELKLTAVERLLSTFANWDKGESAAVMVLLRRFEAEAARDSARKAFAVPDYKHAFDGDLDGLAESDAAGETVTAQTSSADAITAPALRDLEVETSIAVASPVPTPQPVDAIAVSEVAESSTAAVENSADPSGIEAALAMLAEDVAPKIASKQGGDGATVDMTLTQRRRPAYVVDLAALELELMAA